MIKRSLGSNSMPILGPKEDDSLVALGGSFSTSYSDPPDNDSNLEITATKTLEKSLQHGEPVQSPPIQIYDNSRQRGEPVQSPPIQIYDNSRVGNPEVSSPIYIPDTTLREGLVKFTLIGEMKDGSHAPIDILNTAEWFVDNTEVAEIQDGYLIPKKEGSVLITAKIGDIVATAIVIIGKAQLYAIYASKDIVAISKGSVITVEVQGE